MSERGIELVHGGGNVFRDFGDAQADLKQAKAVLAARIIAVLDDRGLAVHEAASLTGFATADFSLIRDADLGHFTLDRLMKMLAALDANARVIVKVHLSTPAEPRAATGGTQRLSSPRPLLGLPKCPHRARSGLFSGYSEW